MITAVNDAPAFASETDTASMAENGSVSTGYTASATDPDGTTPTYSLSMIADNTGLGLSADDFGIDGSGNITYSGSTELDYEAMAPGKTVVLTVQASDGSLSDTQDVTVTFTDVNEAPIIYLDNGDPGTSSGIVVADGGTFASETMSFGNSFSILENLDFQDPDWDDDVSLTPPDANSVFSIFLDSLPTQGSVQFIGSAMHTLGAGWYLSNTGGSLDGVWLFDDAGNEVAQLSDSSGTFLADIQYIAPGSGVAGNDNFNIRIVDGGGLGGTFIQAVTLAVASVADSAKIIGAVLDN